MNFHHHPAFKGFLLLISFLLAASLSLLPKLPAIAQFAQVIPRIDVIQGQKNTPPSYRLIVSRPQDIVFVSCPRNYAPKLGYLRNVEAIQCERL